MNTKEQVEKTIFKCTRLLTVLEKLPTDLDLYFDSWNTKVHVEVVSLDGLEAMRHRLRESLGSWTDKLTFVWESLGSGLASYESPDWPIEIRLKTRLDEFPKEISGDSCRFVATQQTHWSYVCDRKETVV